MQTPRDHVQAYRFATNRLLAAMTGGDPGSGEAPWRRSDLGTVFGAMVAVLLAGAAVLYGVLHPAVDNRAWRHDGAIVVDKDSGTRYVYLHGALYPTANYTSAVLVAGHGSAAVQYLSRPALAGVPRGRTIGIPGAPETLPRSDALLPAPWAWCLAPDGGSASLDLAPAGHTTPLPGDERVFVTDAGAASDPGYLLWHGTRYPLGGHAARLALGLGNAQPIPAPAGWLAALPGGGTLAAATIPGAGAPGPAVGGHRSTIGALFQTSVAGAAEFYVLRADGLAPLTRTEAALLAAAPGGSAAIPVDAATVATAPVSPDQSLLHRLPDVLSGPGPRTGGDPLCVRQSSPGEPGRATLVTEPATRLAAGAVLVPAGGGMLAAAPAATGVGAGPSYLITDTGMKYPLAGGAAATLGYSAATPVRMPDAVLRLIPTGPDLDPAAARRTVPWPSI